ncbi:MAG: hypothetical protein HC911_17820 [Chloroflexaceae bacterium]|nr:hypothetical protein [Chloroflexaceae bacterium]
MSTSTHTRRVHVAPPRPAQRTSYSFAMMFVFYESLSCPAYKLLGVIKTIIFTGETKALEYLVLAERVGCTVSTISRAMRELEQSGFIRRHRAKLGRGHTYTITVVTPEEWEAWYLTQPGDADPAPPLASPAHAGAFFSAPERSSKPIPKHAEMAHYESSVLPIPTPETGAVSAPPDSQIPRIMQQQQIIGGDGAYLREECALTATPNGDSIAASEPPPVAPAAELMSTYTPEQRALYATLCTHNAESVAAELIAINPTRTVADFEADLRAAESRPSVRSPIGLLCHVWGCGSRVTPLRSPTAPDAGTTTPESIPLTRPEPTATEQLLCDVGFHWRTAQEFGWLDVDAVRAVVTNKVLGVMSEQERNYRIGRLVVSWRNGHLPVGQVAGDEGQVTGKAYHEEHEGHEEHEERRGWQVTGAGETQAEGAGETHHDGHEECEGVQVLGEAYAERDDAPIPDPYHLEPDPSDLTPDPCDLEPETYALTPDPCDLEPETPPLTLAELWERAREHLRLLVDAVAFERDLADVRVVGLDAHELLLACPSLTYREHFEKTYLRQVRRVLRELLGVPDLYVHVMLYRP